MRMQDTFLVVVAQQIAQVIKQVLSGQNQIIFIAKENVRINHSPSKRGVKFMLKLIDLSMHEKGTDENRLHTCISPRTKSGYATGAHSRLQAVKKFSQTRASVVFRSSAT